MDSQWMRVFDSQYNSYYWYNNESKESHWEIELEANPEYFDKIKAFKESLERQITLDQNAQSNVLNKFENTSIGKHNVSNDTNDNNSVDIEMVDISTSDKSSITVHENEKLLSSPNERARASANAEIMRKTTLVATSYQMCVYINAFLFEGPLGVLEAGIRSMFFFGVVILLILIRYTLKSSLHNLMLHCLKECIISFAAGISLIIPGMACIIYYKYNASDDWDLYPIPSIIGWVDPRRFLVFTIIGGGSIARNVTLHTSVSSEITNGSLNKATITKEMILGVISREYDCQDDFWCKNINDSNHILLCAPRIMAIAFSKIIRGEYSNDIL